MKNSQNQSSIIPKKSYKHNKRQIPININSNPYPFQFIYNNKKSHLTNSYITIGNEIHRKQKNNDLSDLFYSTQNYNLTQSIRISNNSIINQSIFNKKKLISFSNLVLNDYKERKPINSSFLIKYGIKKKNSINISLNRILNSNNININSKREKINSYLLNKNNNKKNLKKNIVHSLKDKNKINYESSIVTTIHNKNSNNNNLNQEKNKETHNNYITNLEKQISNIRNDNLYFNAKRNIKKKNTNYSKDNKLINNKNNNTNQSKKKIRFYKKNYSILLNFPKNSISNIQNLKRENKINKLLKNKNNPKRIIENKIEKEIEKIDDKLDNNIHLRNSSKLLRENTTLLKIIEKNENNEIEEIKLMNDINEIMGNELDLPLHLNNIMLSPLRENKVNNNNLKNVNNNNYIDDNINKNIYDNDINNKECFFNMLFDESNLDCYCNYDNNFNNIKSVVKKIKFNQVIVNCGNFFSKNNNKYLKYIKSFNEKFEDEIRLNKDKLNCCIRNEINDLSFNSTQPGSYKKNIIQKI